MTVLQHADGDWLGINKYDESEARDEKGQWTATGASTGQPTLGRRPEPGSGQTVRHTHASEPPNAEINPHLADWHGASGLANQTTREMQDRHAGLHEPTAKAPKADSGKDKALRGDLKYVVQFGRLDGAGATALQQAGLATRGDAIHPLVLTDAGKAKLAALSKAEQSVVVQAIAKYSPDQERDSNGQWTAGGGGSSDSTAHAHSIINWNNAQAHIGDNHQHAHPGGAERHNHFEQGIGGMGHTNANGSFSYGPKYVPTVGPKGTYIPTRDAYTIGNHMRLDHHGTPASVHDALHAEGTVTDHYHPEPRVSNVRVTPSRPWGLAAGARQALHNKSENGIDGRTWTGDWLDSHD